MLYIGISSFTTNSAAFVYNKAGALSLYITDDMVRIVPPGNIVSYSKYYKAGDVMPFFPQNIQYKNAYAHTVNFYTYTPYSNSSLSRHLPKWWVNAYRCAFKISKILCS